MKTRTTVTIFTTTIVVFALASIVSRSHGHSPAGPPPSSFEIVHFVETKGRITTAQNAFDTTIYAHYSGSASLTVEISLYDSNGGVIPLNFPRCRDQVCSYGFTRGSRQIINFEDLIDFSNRNVVVGYATIKISGDSAATFNADIYEVNSRTSPFDLSYVLLPLHPLP